MKRPLLAIAALALMAIPTTAAHAGPELPGKYLGHWCYNYDEAGTFRMAAQCDKPAWINIHPTGFAMSDGNGGGPTMYCTLKSTSLKLDVFKCRGNEVGNTTEHMRLSIDHNNTLHLGWKK